MVQINIKLLSLVVAGTLAVAAPTQSPAEIFKRDVTCRDDLGPETLARANEAAECINYLASLGGQACVATVSGQSFCRRGQTQITGLSRRNGNTQSSCQDVARGAGQIMDRCTRGDGTVRGANPAWGNGHLLVDIRRVP